MSVVKYTHDEMADLIQKMSMIFDIVRLVDPIEMVVYECKNGKIVESEFKCHQVWKKSIRCENCVSSRCFVKQNRCSKFEFIDDKVYHVVAQCVEIDSKRYVLEIAAVVHNDVWFDAFGHTDFVNQITNYNQQIYLDSLTGIHNRRYFDDKFCLLLEECYREKASLAVAMIDIDDFKIINDTYGHVEGDKTIKFVAQLLQQNFSLDRGDIIVRYGGDEFFIALKNIPLWVLKLRIEEIEVVVKNYGFSLSIGICYMTIPHTLSVENVVVEADNMLYDVKSKGKATYGLNII